MPDKQSKILHIDGNKKYLDICLRVYEEFELKAFGAAVAEKDMPKEIIRLLKEYKPDILIITGHDYIIDKDGDWDSIDNYLNSKYFIEAVKEARKYEPDKDKLLIFAGACQSYYEALLQAGANFASSPQRVLIHCLDPVFLVESIAFNGKVLTVKEIVEDTISGHKGIGGAGALPLTHGNGS